MFHAELAYKNVQNEIANLTSKQKARDTALQSSKEELNNDRSALMAFIAGDNKEKKDKELKEKLAIAKRQERDDKIKQLDMEIQQVKSDIDKHKDALGDLQMNQRFILELTPEDFKKKRDEGVA